jgi:cytochrome P450
MLSDPQAVPIGELDLPFLDNGSEQYEADPYGVIDELRGQSWIVRSRYGYTVLSNRRAREIKKSTAFVRIFDAVTEEESPYLFDKASRSVSSQSGQTLVRMRRLMLQALRPRMVALLQPKMSAIFHDLLDGLSDGGSGDLIADAVTHYPGLVMGPVLGVPFADAKELDRWASTINIMGNHAAYAEHLGRIEESYRNMEAYLTEVIADRRKNPTNDVLGDLVANAVADPDISDDQLLMLALSLVNASIDNTRSELALTIEALIRHPDQWRALQADPELLLPAVEEGLRYAPAGDDIQHRVPAATELDGIAFPEGSLVFIHKKAVNRDPDAIEDPHSFRLDRDSSAHLTFGFGLHACVGATVARAAIGEALLALTNRVESWELLGPPERGPMASGGAPYTLPLDLRLGSRPVVEDQLAREEVASAAQR